MKFVVSSLVVFVFVVQFLWLRPDAILSVPQALVPRLFVTTALRSARRVSTGVTATVGNLPFEFPDVDKLCSLNHKIIFFEGFNCTQQAVGSHGLDAPNRDRSRTCPEENIRRKECWDNDEARSLALVEGFPPQSVITVCDDPDNCSKDDFTIIETIKEIPVNFTYCVPTFEQTYRDEYVVVSYVKITDSGSLDGKVSRVSACFYG
eukprot:TRINITY_DN9505_c1_g1_i1.p3 TRINITY_DN9505_c1_g1~~TRINITY_DN9505_c1_g1_i1.p3  ORF type:complete len:206 (-),score=22.72 TRINITY_DN9505_c1_g1_i1:335-952(-)